MAAFLAKFRMLGVTWPEKLLGTCNPDGWLATAAAVPESFNE
jgi:hypothetical protein